MEAIDDRAIGSRLRALQNAVRADRHLVAYVLIGLSAIAVDLGLFYLAHDVGGLSPVVANIISVNAAILWSFGLNTWINFRVTDRLLRRLAMFYAVSLGGLALSSGLIAIFAVGLDFDAFLVKVATLPLVTAFQYLLNRRFSFAEQSEGAIPTDRTHSDGTAEFRAANPRGPEER